jgi:hypothetical protein
MQAVSDFNTFSADDIDEAFKCIKTLKHHQLLELELQGLRFRLVGYPSGHMIGGTVWTIETGGETLVYAPATNHSKERCAWVCLLVLSGGGMSYHGAQDLDLSKHELVGRSPLSSEL